MSDQSKSDQAKKASLDQIIATVANLGIAGDTYLEDLPPQVRSMLESYVSGYEPGDRSGALQRIWSMVGDSVTKQSVNASTPAAPSKPATTVGQAAVDKAANSGAPSPTTLGLPTTPRWLLQSLSAQGQGDPTFDQKKRIAAEWNTVFGTKLTYDQLITTPQFNDPTDTGQKVVQGALMDVEPQVSYSVTLPGNRKFDISSDQQKTQFGLYGYKNEDISRIVRWADAFDLKDSTGAVAWQPLAALIKARGLDPSTAFKDQSGVDPETGKVLADSRHPVRGKPVPKGPAPYDRLAANNEMGIAMITQAYKQNLAKYGDPTMAYLAAFDSGLTDRLMASGGDSTKVSNQDAILAEQYMLNGQWSPQAQRSLGYASGSGLDAFMQNLSARANSTTSTRSLPDPESLKQSVKDMWRSWFRSEPSEALVSKMVGDLSAAVSTAPKDQSVDVNARLRQMAESSPEYKKLYGNKQPGQTEADYQGQFVAASQDLLGNEAPDNGAVLAGMQSGQYQTTIGATAASARAMQNSKFLGRLASAAQILNAET